MSHQGQQYRKTSEGKFFPVPTTYHVWLRELADRTQAYLMSQAQGPYDQRLYVRQDNQNQLSNYSTIPPEQFQHPGLVPLQYQQRQRQAEACQVDREQRPISELPQSQREKFKKNYIEIYQQILKFKGLLDQETLNALFAKAQQKDLELFQTSSYVKEYQDKSFKILNDSLTQLNKMKNVISGFQELQNYVPTIEYILAKYYAKINDIETQLLDIKITKEREQQLKDEKLQCENHFNQIKSIISNIRKGPSFHMSTIGPDQTLAMIKKYLSFFNMGYIQQCHQIVNSMEYQQPVQYNADPHLQLGKRSYQQNFNQLNQPHQYREASPREQPQVKRVRTSQFSKDYQQSVQSRHVTSTNYTTSDSQQNQRYVNEPPHNYQNEKMNHYLNKHGITSANDNPVYQQDMRGSKSNHTLSHISQAAHIIQQQQSQELTKLRNKPQMGASQLLDTLKKYQSTTDVKVIELKDLRVNNFEEEIMQIQKEKEKQDRAGPFLGQIHANISCKFDDSNQSEKRTGKAFAYKTYQQRKLFLEETLQLNNQKEIIGSGVEEEQLPQANTVPDDYSKQQQLLFKSRVTTMLNRAKDSQIDIKFSKDNVNNFHITLSKDQSDIENKTVLLYIDCGIEKAYITEIKKINRLHGEEISKNLELEFDMDNVESLFEDKFFDKYLTRQALQATTTTNHIYGN